MLLCRTHSPLTSARHLTFHIRPAALQSCVINGNPIPQATFSELQAAVTSFTALNSALPKIRGFAHCAFVDRAFVQVINDNCGPMEDAAVQFSVGALLGAVGFALTLFYMCPCVRCGSPFGGRLKVFARC